MFALLMCLTCSILGLRRDCTDDDVRKYYRRQAVLVHPDKVHVFIACYPLPPTHTHTCLVAICLGLPRWAGTTKVKPIWILLEQWHRLGNMQVCTLLQSDNEASTPPLSFLQVDALPATQPTVSKHWRLLTPMRQIPVMWLSVCSEVQIAGAGMICSFLDALQTLDHVKSCAGLLPELLKCCN